MVEYIYLKPGEQMPEMADEDAWLVVEASDDDRFFGHCYCLCFLGPSTIL